MLEQRLLTAAAAFATGLLLGGLGAGLALAWRRRALRAAQQQLHELALDHASLESAHTLLQQQRSEDLAELRQLREQRGHWLAEQARAQAREEALERRQREQLATLQQLRQQMAGEFENLANRIFEERGRHLGASHNAALEALLKPFAEQVQQFRTRVDEVHREAVAGQAGLAEQLRQLQQANLQMGEQARSLSRALLGDKKTTGNWGELQLERALQLAGLERGQHYVAQAALRSSDGQRQLPDFLIKLPDGKHLVLDSKVSLVDYRRAVAAQDDTHRAAALAAHVQATRRHIDGLAGKDYAAAPGLDSPGLVFLFMPVEAAFVEALRQDPGLFEYGHRRNVILASPTTLLPMLRTVADLWIAHRSDREARALSQAAGEIHNKVVVLSQRLEELGRTLGTAIGKYNETVTALVGRQGLQGKLARFRGIAANARGEMPQPTTRHPAVDHDRLASRHGDGEAPATSPGEE